MTAAAQTNTTQLLIGNRWSDAAGGATYADANPATGGPLAGVAEATREDVDLDAGRKNLDAPLNAKLAQSALHRYGRDDHGGDGIGKATR